MGFDSALKTIDAQMLFWSEFLKKHKQKVIDCQKHHCGHLCRLTTVFLCVFKNTVQNNICVSIVYKGKTEKNLEKKKLVEPQKRAFLSCEIKP